MVKNPANDIERMSVPILPPTLPSQEQFAALLERLDKGPQTAPAAFVVRLLAFTGLRQNEARHLERRDVESRKTASRERFQSSPKVCLCSKKSCPRHRANCCCRLPASGGRCPRPAAPSAVASRRTISGTCSPRAALNPALTFARSPRGWATRTAGRCCSNDTRI